MHFASIGQPRFVGLGLRSLKLFMLSLAGVWTILVPVAAAETAGAQQPLLTISMEPTVVPPITVVPPERREEPYPPITTALPLERNVNLLRFKASASTMDTRLTSVSFNAREGHLQNATNYTLWADLGGVPGVVETVLRVFSDPGMSMRFPDSGMVEE